MTVNEEIRDALRKVYKSNDSRRTMDNKRTRQTASSPSAVSQDPTSTSMGVATPQDVAEELTSIPLSSDPRMGLCVPLIVANDKNWHEPTLQLAERRANNVFSLVQAMCYIDSPAYSLNPKMDCSVRCAKYLEKKFYNNANSRRQYFLLVATSIYELEKKHGRENRKLMRLSSRAGFATGNPRLTTTNQLEPFPPMPNPVVRQYRQISRRSSGMLPGKYYPSARHEFPTGFFQPPVGVVTGELSEMGFCTGLAQPSARESAEKLGIDFRRGPIGYQPAVRVFPAPSILALGRAGSQALLQAGSVSSSTAGYRPSASAASVSADQVAQPTLGGSLSHALITPDGFPGGANSTLGAFRRVSQDPARDSRDAATQIDAKPSTKVDDESAIGQRLAASRIAQIMVSANSNRETVPKMNKVMEYAGKIENEVYQLAQTKEEYYDCIAERICKVHNKFMGDVQEHQKERVMTKLENKIGSPKVDSRKRSFDRPGKSKENNDNECNEKKFNTLDKPSTIDKNDESET